VQRQGGPGRAASGGGVRQHGARPEACGSRGARPASQPQPASQPPARAASHLPRQLPANQPAASQPVKPPAGRQRAGASRPGTPPVEDKSQRKDYEGDSLNSRRRPTLSSLNVRYHASKLTVLLSVLTLPASGRSRQRFITYPSAPRR
jgi:hypothetical protein